jgi:hypothetical protein
MMLETDLLLSEVAALVMIFLKIFLAVSFQDRTRNSPTHHIFPAGYTI